MCITETFRFAQTNAVDDRSMVQRVADQRILRPEQSLEEARVRIEARREENRVLRSMELCDFALELLMNVLRTADESHGAHAESVRIERLLRRGDQIRMVRQTEVIVRAEVEHLGSLS